MSYRGRDKETLLPFHDPKKSKDSHTIKEVKQGGRKLKIYWRYISLFFCIWLCIIQYYERTVVKRSMRGCAWEKWEKWPKDAERHRVALLADPQIMDAHSYPGRPRIINYFTKNILDNYHSRNWRYMQYYLDPDSTFFLGDLFDGGRRWDDDQWIEEYERFQRLFPKKPNRLTVMSLPGNHDIGFGDTVVEESFKRFTSYFGDTSSTWNVGNHTFVLLDTISLSDNANPNVSVNPRMFLDRFKVTEHSYPRIMLTHVPLWRDPSQQTCGELRESKEPFPIMYGDQYQTVINSELTHQVLSVVQPDIVFSGDDHDYCFVKHSYIVNGHHKAASEITVKSCAMNMGVSKPAIQLLSLHNPSVSSESETYHTTICYLPDPYKPIKVYLALFTITVGVFVWICFLPESFNRVIAKHLTADTIANYTLLPISSKKLDTYNQKEKKTDSYIIQETPALWGFISNGGLLALLVFMIFAFYYRQFS